MQESDKRFVKAVVSFMGSRHPNKEWPLSDEVFYDEFNTAVEELWGKVLEEASQVTAVVQGAHVPFVAIEEDEDEDECDDEDEECDLDDDECEDDDDDDDDGDE